MQQIIMLRIKRITKEEKDLDIIRQLFRDYEKEMDEDICFQSFEAELNDPLKKYGPPSGDLLLAFWNDEAAGCIALTSKKEAGVCEMKRLYVKPEFRANKIGKILISELLSSAREKGYTSMRLDTLTKLQPAIRLYEKLGFKNISANHQNPQNGVLYMEMKL